VLGEALQQLIGLPFDCLGHEQSFQLAAVRNLVEKAFRFAIALGQAQQRVGFADDGVRGHQRPATIQEQRKIRACRLMLRIVGHLDRKPRPAVHEDPAEAHLARLRFAAQR
jgi:hypothetical protein